MSGKILEKLTSVSSTDVLVFFIPITILIMVILGSFVFEGSQQFSNLAASFLHGQTNFLTPIGGVSQDPILYHGKIYWGEGPLPGLLLVPFVAIFRLFHTFFFQGYLQWLFVLAVFYIVFRLARQLSYTMRDSIILAFGFTLGGVFIGVSVTANSWFFAQVITTFLLFWSLYEFYHKKRWWLIGFICALILLTRITAAPILLFYGLEVFSGKFRAPLIKSKMTQLGVPIIGALILICTYNYSRFHNPLNGGFAYQVIGPIQARTRSIGIFSPSHIPTNLYDALLSAPLAVFKSGTWVMKFPYVRYNPFGMSLFITSPYLLYLFTIKRISITRRDLRMIASISVSGLIVLMYYGVGMNQFGYRYGLDFLPLLFLFFMIKYRENHSHLSLGMKILLLGSGIANFYLLWTFI